MQLDTATLVAVLAASNLLVAAALWIAFPASLRRTLRRWTGALVVHAAAWVLLLADSTVSLVIAGAALVYGWTLQVSGALEFHGRRLPAWLLYGLPLIAFGAAAAAFFAGALSPLSEWHPASAIWLFGVYGVTVASSLAFVLMHKARTRELANTDELTGVYNRRMFKQLAEARLSQARRAGMPMAVLALDLDRFKRVNDLHGHKAGDEVLVAFAALVRRRLRKEDLLARYGGEEFVALLPDATEEAAAALAERIRAELAWQPLRAAGREVEITVSIGVVSGTGEELPSLDTLLTRADEALYSAKTAGRNRVISAAAGSPAAA